MNPHPHLTLDFPRANMWSLKSLLVLLSFHVTPVGAPRAPRRRRKRGGATPSKVVAEAVEDSVASTLISGMLGKAAGAFGGKIGDMVVDVWKSIRLDA